MKDKIWNIMLGTLATAILGLLGYVLVNLNNMQQQEAAQTALDFTNQDAAQLQKELTQIITDIDIRLRLIERDIQWLKSGSNFSIIESPMPDPPPPPEPPRYKLDAIKK